MKKIYFPNLNGVRFFAALSVIIYHFWGLDKFNGHLGVILFFVLSGFLITYLLFEEKSDNNTISIYKFYLRRVLRIWPLYFLIIIISSTYYFLNNPDVDYFFNIIPYYLFFIPNLAFTLGKILLFAGILWSVGSEEQFYFFWPWIIEKFKKKNVFIIFIIIIAFFMFVPHLIDYVNNHFLNNNKPLYHTSILLQRMSFGSMATGGILAYIAIFKKDYLKYLFNKYFQIFILFLLLSCWILDINFLFNDQFYATLFGILIINFAINPNVIFSLENRILDYLGKISYGIYVYHLMAYGINNFTLTLLHINDIPAIIRFITGLFWTILIASISYKFIERPFLKIKSEKFTIVKSEK